MADEPPLVSIVIVNWNTADLVARCLASIRRHVDLRYELIVVDNASSDDSVERIRAEAPDGRLIEMDRNVGYARANNRALEEAVGRYLFLLNPDTEVRAGAIEDLIAYLENEPKVGIAGPTLWNPDGTHQPSTAALPSLWTEFLRQTMLWVLVPGLAGRRSRGNVASDVPLVSGAALAIRRACFEDIGPLDDAIFMFYEDTDWCRRAWQAGWKVAFRPGPGIVHVRRAASGGAVRVHTLLASQRSAIHYFEKHHGKGSVRAFRLVTLVGSCVRLLRASIEWIVGWQRSDRASRIRAYARILGWAITGRGLDEPGDA